MHINLFLFLIIFFFFSCDSSKTHEPEWIENVVFNINNERLSPYYVLSDSSTMFRPPKDWIQGDELVVSTLNQNLGNDHVVPISAEHIFTSSLGSIIIVSKIKSEKNNFDYIPNDFLELMKSEHKLDSIPNYSFMINNLLVRQYKIDLKDVIIFKYFIESNNNYQLDFILNKQEDNKQIESIESSIGSLTRKGDKK